MWIGFLYAGYYFISLFLNLQIFMFMFSIFITEFHVKIYRLRIYYFSAGASQTVKSTKTKTRIPVFIPRNVV